MGHRAVDGAATAIATAIATATAPRVNSIISTVHEGPSLAKSTMGQRLGRPIAGAPGGSLVVKISNKGLTSTSFRLGNSNSNSNTNANRNMNTDLDQRRRSSHGNASRGRGGAAATRRTSMWGVQVVADTPVEKLPRRRANPAATTNTNTTTTTTYNRMGIDIAGMPIPPSPLYGGGGYVSYGIGGKLSTLRGGCWSWCWCGCGCGAGGGWE
jgi:hypothetical protein